MRNGKKFEAAYAIFAGVIYTLVLTILVMVLATNSCGASLASWGPDQEWTVRYEPYEGITSYWFYWSADGRTWSDCQRLMVPAEEPWCRDDGGGGPWDTCGDLGALNDLTGGDYAYVTVTAVNATGESDWDRAFLKEPC